MEISAIHKNGENILAICFYGKNRNQEVLEWQKKVFNYFNIHISYIEWPFHLVGHGDAIQEIINRTLHIKEIDYYMFIDFDAIPTRKDIIDIIYDKIKDKKTIFGPAWTSNHKSPDHIHAAACFLAFSKELYIKLGCPPMHDRIPRSDNVEELSWVAAEKGYNISLVYPQSYNELTEEECKETGNPKSWNLGNKFKYGLGTQYSDLLFHCGMASVKRSSEVFINRCKEILGEKQNNKLEAVIVCVNRTEFLRITYPLNVKFFDNIVVVTSFEDKNTQIFCEINNIEYITTNKFYNNNALFDKGAAINEGFKKLLYNDWVLHLDCDIILPEDFKDKIQLQNLDINKLYGASRWFIKTQKDWLDYNNGLKKKEDFEFLDGGDGCGYFQLFNLKAQQIKDVLLNELYPSYPTAAESDILFLKRFHPNVLDVGRLDLEVCHLGDYGKHDGTDKPEIKFFN